jgi:hypothetical protein
VAWRGVTRGVAWCVTWCVVGLLVDGDDLGKQHAAAAIARLATSCGEAVSTDIAKAGAIEPLVQLLNGQRGDAAQEQAAGALYALAEHKSNRLEITEAGGVGPLPHTPHHTLAAPLERIRSTPARLSPPHSIHTP